MLVAPESRGRDAVNGAAAGDEGPPTGRRFVPEVPPDGAGIRRASGDGYGRESATDSSTPPDGHLDGRR